MTPPTSVPVHPPQPPLGARTRTLAYIKSTVSPGSLWDITNHYITRADHPCCGTKRRTVSRVTASRFYYVADYRNSGEGYIDWPRAAQVQCDADGTIALFGGGAAQELHELFITMRPVAT